MTSAFPSPSTPLPKDDPATTNNVKLTTCTTPPASTKRDDTRKHSPSPLPPSPSSPSSPSSLPSIHHGQVMPPPPPPTGFPSTTAPSEVGALRHGPHALHVVTDFVSPPTASSHSFRPSPTETIGLSPNRPANFLHHRISTSSLRLPTPTPSVHAALAGSIASIGSVSGASSGFPSPMITAMGDMTPLPSPLLSSDSPGPWKKMAMDPASMPRRRDKLKEAKDDQVHTHTDGAQGSGPALAKQRLHNLEDETARQILPKAPSLQSHPQWHSRNRSISDYSTESTAMAARQLTGSTSRIKAGSRDEPQIRRERNLAESRGLTPAAVDQPPTPPPSESSRDSTDATMATPQCEYFEARDRNDQKLRRWRSLRTVGQGTFSRVVLATSQMSVPENTENTENIADPCLDRRTLVAVKVCEHGPRGGASEERVEMSLKRELEIMQSIHHPSLVDLKAWSIEPTRAMLVLSYCPGGDLFDVATTHRRVLTPPLMRRIYAEVVGAVSYLHSQMIVHRDIKLENVLVNLTPDELRDASIDWTTYPYSVTALADLGLSRRIAAEEKLETRCGSEDYAAPEVIMGQPYDGRATDAWSLGVLLYALLESRLPFDPHPGMSDSHRMMRSRKSHRIARLDWRWFEYEGEDGEHEGSEAKFGERGLSGAMRITQGLLKRARSRWTLDMVSAEPWVGGALDVKGGLRFREEMRGAEVVNAPS